MQNEMIVAKSEDFFIVGNLNVDLVRQRVVLQNEPVFLRADQFAILRILLTNKNEVVSRKTLMETLGTGILKSRQQIDSQITHLRKKLHRFSGSITAVHHQGYRLSEIQNPMT